MFFIFLPDKEAKMSSGRVAGSFPVQRLEIEPRNDEQLVIFDLFLFSQFQELLLHISFP